MRSLPPVVAFCLVLPFAGCSCSGEMSSAGDDAGTGGNDLGAPDLGTIDLSVPDDTGVPTLLDGGFVELDGGGVCQVTLCQDAQGRVSMAQCGNCQDDDEDGLVDLDDPECLSYCDDHEATFSFFDPASGGGDTPSCNLDCYYDSDVGFGNDRCRWSGACDPLEPDALCAYDESLLGSNTCPDEQPQACAENCGPLVPNGCDCFGCCELPAGTGRFVYIGTGAAERDPTCDLAGAEAQDDTRCAPCTPRLSDSGCYNDCGPCELCLGRELEDLPCDCFAPGTAPSSCTPIDIGVPNDMGPPSDAGTMDGGTITPPWDCGERQPCDFPGLPECGPSSFCVTGCCSFLG